MFAKRSKQSSEQQPPSDDGSQTEQSGSQARENAIERLERELEEQRLTAQRLREALDAATFKFETLEKSYAKQLAETRDKLAAAETELEEKLQILSGAGDGYEYTLRALHDALAVIKELKAERDQLRKEVAKARHSPKAPLARPRPSLEDTSGAETINAILSNTIWATQKPKINTGHATARAGEQASEQETPREDMLAPEQVFTPDDKDEER